MKRDVSVHRWLEVCDREHLVGQIDAIFFDASSVKVFESDERRMAFRDLWLGDYLSTDQKWFYVALAGPQTVVGYLAGSTEDPARNARFEELDFYGDFARLTLQFPAHLHINIDASHRGRGIGADLIEAFVCDIVEIGLPGVHVVTGWQSRNVRFYKRVGFRQFGISERNGKTRVFLGRRIEK